METVTTLPRSRALTRADLGQVPDDGHRYELLDGALVVTPAPSPLHQVVSFRLGVLLDAACPPELRVLSAPLDVSLADDTVLQPDLLVARRDDFTDRDLPVAPLLVVEVLSPSTRLIDLNLKKARYEQAGCASYWVVDPTELRLMAWDLDEGVFVDVADLVGAATWTAGRPFEVTIRPADLVK